MKSLTTIIEGKENMNDTNQYICLKEYTNYEVIIERKNKPTIEFYHENPNIRDKVTPTGRGGAYLAVKSKAEYFKNY